MIKVISHYFNPFKAYVIHVGNDYEYCIAEDDWNKVEEYVSLKVVGFETEEVAKTWLSDLQNEMMKEIEINDICKKAINTLIQEC